MNHKVCIDPKIEEGIKNGTVQSYKKHPGITSRKFLALPTNLTDAIDNVLQTYSIPHLQKRCEKMCNYLWKRQQPVDNAAKSVISEQLMKQFIDKGQFDFTKMSTEEISTVEEKLEQKVIRRMKSRIYNWKAMNYNAQRSMIYMVGRIAMEYRSLYRIFSEIATQDASFKPKTLFDFGSGVGSVMWAANNVWTDQISEHYCVDSSDDMNTLARLLLQGGLEEKEMCFPGVYFRQFFPVSKQNNYDLVVSAYSMFELPTQEERFTKLLSLWEKTEKYLVIVEDGTYAGFTLVSEARDFILQYGERYNEETLKAHVFSPCPHDKLCPRGLRNDGTPCNFAAKYQLIPVLKDNSDFGVSTFSFVVLKKGERDKTVTQWPRIVRPIHLASKHINVRTCSINGELEVNTITSSRHGKGLYECTKASNWGDQFPVINSQETFVSKKVKVDQTNEEFKDQTSEEFKAQTSEEFKDQNVTNTDTSLSHVEDINEHSTTCNARTNQNIGEKT